MIGLAVFAAAGIYVGLAFVLVRSVHSAWGRLLGGILAVAIPFWDLPFGYYSFLNHCWEDAGLHVDRPIPSSVLIIDRTAGYSPEELKRAGLKTFEYETTNGVVRYTSANGALSRSIARDSSGELRLSYIGNQRLPWNIIRNQYVLMDDRHDLLAHQTEYRWLGVWWQVWANGLFGSGAECTGTNDDSIVGLVAKRQ